MKKIFFIVFAGIISSCGSNSGNKPAAMLSASSEPDANKLFDSYKEGFIENLWKLYPGWASSQGYHKYDSILSIPDEAYHQREIAFANRNLDSLKKFDYPKLLPSNKADFYILKNALNGFLFNIQEFREYEWNPAFYNVGSLFADILQNKNASNEKNLRAVYDKMKGIAAYYTAAKKMVRNPTREHTLLAIQQNKGSEELFTGMMMDSLRKCHFDVNETERIEARIKESVRQIGEYITWLQKDVVPGLKEGTARSFRIGKDLYEKKFQYDIVSKYTAEQVYNKALERKGELHTKMLEITNSLFSKYFPNVHVAGGLTSVHIKMLIDEISKKHVAAKDFQSEIEQQIPMLTKFVSDKDLIYLDPQKPLVVRKEPAYMAGVAGASMSAPGPYDKEGNSYYNVGSLAGYSPQEAESYLREYNYYILQILSIHEAIPGHYVQLVYSNRSPSILKSIFGNGAMIEGWAVYAERMMMENGFGNNEPEMWLMYYKWHLRTVCNMILDYKTQVLGMTKEEAIRFLVEEGFQQKQEADNKWKRATLTQVQLTSYFTGYTEIYELREELKSTWGAKFNLKEFNEKFLSYGSAPVKCIRELMLEK
jgi:uncharacterized protein (DUF885 family)